MEKWTKTRTYGYEQRSVNISYNVMVSIEMQTIIETVITRVSIGVQTAGCCCESWCQQQLSWNRLRIHPQCMWQYDRHRQQDQINSFASYGLYRPILHSCWSHCLVGILHMLGVIVTGWENNTAVLLRGVLGQVDGRGEKECGVPVVDHVLTIKHLSMFNT